MKIYPKVPHYYYDVVPADFFDEGVLYLTEKLDGGNFCVSLYEERFADEYPERLLEVDPEDGELVFGTKKTVRGTTADPVEAFDGSLHRAVRHLKEDVDRDAIRALHDEHGTVTLFCENMAYHTLDYGYETDPPPALIGFDICAHNETDSFVRPPNPYEQVFEGFLDIQEAMAWFDRMGIEPVVDPGEITAVDAAGFDPDEFEFPESEYGSDVVVEGVVVRKPDSSHRVKIVREEFEEMNRELWGLSESEAENGNELFVAKYCTHARIEKTINKMTVDEGRELSMELMEDLWPRVVDDIWEEHWRDIKQESFEFTPAEVKPMVASICRGVLKRKIKNAKLNDAPAEDTFSL